MSKPKHSPIVKQSLSALPTRMQSMRVYGGYWTDGGDPGVMLEADENPPRMITVETAYGLANGLLLAAGYGEADGFILYFFENVDNDHPTEHLRGSLLHKLRNSRNWPPPLFDPGLQLAYGFSQRGVPFVTLTIDGSDRQLNAEDARWLAHGLQLAAEDSRNNAMLMRVLIGEAGFDLEAQAQQQMIMVLTYYRELVKKKQATMSHPPVDSA